MPGHSCISPCIFPTCFSFLWFVLIFPVHLLFCFVGRSGGWEKKKSFPVSASGFISSSSFPFFLFASQLCLHRSDKALLRVDVTSICTSSVRDKCHGNRCRIIFCLHHNPHCERSLQSQIITKDLCIFQIWPWRRVASFSWSLEQGELEIWIDLSIPTVSLKQNLADCLLQFCFVFPSVFFDVCVWFLEVQFLSGISSILFLHQIKGGCCAAGGFWVPFWFCPLPLAFQLCWIISLISGLCKLCGQKSFSEMQQLSNSCVGLQQIRHSELGG